MASRLGRGEKMGSLIPQESIALPWSDREDTAPQSNGGATGQPGGVWLFQRRSSYSQPSVWGQSNGGNVQSPLFEATHLTE